jgi:heme-degrading monooxygenase HmoA
MHSGARPARPSVCAVRALEALAAGRSTRALGDRDVHRAMTRYTYIWAFQVRSDRLEEFLSHYTGAGSWALLFRRARGYVGTRLLRDRHDPLRFVTVDDWESIEHYQAFRTQFSSEYEKLDQICEGLTSGETPLGQYYD